MSTTTNNGNQVLYFSYLEEATGKGFDKTVYQLLPRGIYSGGTLTRVNDTQITIGKFVCYYEDNTNSVGVKIESSINAIVDLSPITPYIIGHFDWVESKENYMELKAVAYAAIGDDDLIFGRAIFNGSTLVNFDYCRKSWSMAYYKKLSTYIPPFRVDATEPYSLYVEVNPGSFYFGNNKIELTSVTTSPVFSSSTLGRIDLLCIDTSSVLHIISSADSSTPTIPKVPFNYVPIAKITFPASANTVVGSYIEYIYNSDYKPDFNEYLGTNWNASLHTDLRSNMQLALANVIGLGDLANALSLDYSSGDVFTILDRIGDCATFSASCTNLPNANPYAVYCVSKGLVAVNDRTYLAILLNGPTGTRSVYFGSTASGIIYWTRVQTQDMYGTNWTSALAEALSQAHVPSSSAALAINSSWNVPLAAVYVQHDPIGTVKMFSGSFTNNSTIPGWYICDGNNGTPNLVGKFVRGGSSSGATGGSDTHTLTTDELPAHNHPIGFNSGSGGFRSTILNIVNSGLGSTGGTATYTGLVSSNTGSGSSISILPTYYTLIFIMRIS